MLSGIVTAVRFLQFVKVSFPMMTTPSGIAYSVKSNGANATSFPFII